MLMPEQEENDKSYNQFFISSIAHDHLKSLNHLTRIIYQHLMLISLNNADQIASVDLAFDIDNWWAFDFFN